MIKYYVEVRFSLRTSRVIRDEKGVISLKWLDSNEIKKIGNVDDFIFECQDEYEAISKASAIYFLNKDIIKSYTLNFKYYE